MRKPSPKVPCSHPGCRAYAMHGSDPPICSVHAGRHLQPGPDRQVGAPPGNDNHLVHGYYSRIVRDFDGEPLPTGAPPSLDDEIAIVRVALRRTVAMLLAGATLEPNPRRLDILEIARFGSLAFHGASTMGRLLEIQDRLGASGDTTFSNFMNSILDDISKEWGIEL